MSGKFCLILILLVSTSGWSVTEKSLEDVVSDLNQDFQIFIRDVSVFARKMELSMQNMEDKMEISMQNMENKMKISLQNMEDKMKISIQNLDSEMKLSVKDLKSETTENTQTMETLKTNVQFSMQNLENKTKVSVQNVENKMKIEIQNLESKTKVAVQNMENKLSASINDLESKTKLAAQNTENKLSTSIKNLDSEVKRSTENLKTRMSTAEKNTEQLTYNVAAVNNFALGLKDTNIYTTAPQVYFYGKTNKDDELTVYNRDALMPGPGCVSYLGYHHRGKIRSMDTVSYSCVRIYLHSSDCTGKNSLVSPFNHSGLGWRLVTPDGEFVLEDNLESFGANIGSVSNCFL